MKAQAAEDEGAEGHGRFNHRDAMNTEKTWLWDTCSVFIVSLWSYSE